MVDAEGSVRAFKPGSFAPQSQRSNMSIGRRSAPGGISQRYEREEKEEAQAAVKALDNFELRKNATHLTLSSMKDVRPPRNPEDYSDANSARLSELERGPRVPEHRGYQANRNFGKNTQDFRDDYEKTMHDRTHAVQLAAPKPKQMTSTLPSDRSALSKISMTASERERVDAMVGDERVKEIAIRKRLSHMDRAEQQQYRKLINEVQEKVEKRNVNVNKLFRYFDEDHDGHVSMEEFRRGLAHLGITVSQKDLKILTDIIDHDKSGQMDYREFNNVLRRQDITHKSIAGLCDDAPDDTVKRKGKRMGLGPVSELQKAENAESRQLTEDEKYLESLRHKVMTKLYQKNYHLRNVFRLFDAGTEGDRDGTIDKEEFNRGLNLLQIKLQNDEVDYLWDQMDRDGSGKVDYYEFAQAVKPRDFTFMKQAQRTGRRRERGSIEDSTQLYESIIKPVVKSHMTEAEKDLKKVKDKITEAITLKTRDLPRVFAKFDPDGDGVLTADEMKKGLKDYGVQLDDRQLNLLVDAIDKNADGDIDYDAFVRVIKAKDFPSDPNYDIYTEIRPDRGRKTNSQIYKNLKYGEDPEFQRKWISKMGLSAEQKRDRHIISKVIQLIEFKRGQLKDSIFVHYERDANGQVNKIRTASTKEEIRQGFEKLGVSMTPNEMEKVMQYMKTDGDHITYSQFVQSAIDCYFNDPRLTDKDLLPSKDSFLATEDTSKFKRHGKENRVHGNMSYRSDANGLTHRSNSVPLTNRSNVSNVSGLSELSKSTHRPRDYTGMDDYWARRQTYEQNQHRKTPDMLNERVGELSQESELLRKERWGIKQLPPLDRTVKPHNLRTRQPGVEHNNSSDMLMASLRWDSSSSAGGSLTPRTLKARELMQVGNRMGRSSPYAGRSHMSHDILAWDAQPQ